MAGRNNKESLDYFELDCHMDEKVRLIQAEFGLKGFALVVKLYQKIYGEHGYYCEWNEDSLLLFMSENGVHSRSEYNLINDVVQACIRREIFSEQIYKDCGVLTSVGVQKQYLKATAKRESVTLKKEYLLINVPENRTNVAISSISDEKNLNSYGRNEQSRVEKRKKDDKNTSGRFTPPSAEEVNAYCLARKNGINGEEFVDFYTAKGWMIGKNRMKDWKAAVRTWEKKRKGSSGQQASKQNAFNHFPQNNYDFDALEKALLDENGGRRNERKQ